MDSFEWNKIFAAVIASVLLIMVIGIIAEQPFHHEEAEPAYTVEVAVASTAEAVVDAGPSFPELMAAASADAGKRQWAKCRSCHTIEKDGNHGQGPNLYGVVGRSVAAIDGFSYSGALAALGTRVWTYEELDAWLTAPQSYAKGSKMVLAVRKPEQRADLLAYLATFTDQPVPLPAIEAPEEAPAEAAEAVAEAVDGQ